MEISLIIIGIIILFSFTGIVIAKARKHKLNEDTIRSSNLSDKKGVIIKTGLPHKDANGNVFDIYISSTGSAFYYKTSSITGKQYKHYLGRDISKQVCAKLGLTYSSNSNVKSKDLVNC